MPIHLPKYDYNFTGLFLLASSRGCLSLLSLKYQTRGSLNNRNLFAQSLEAGSVWSGCEQGGLLQDLSGWPAGDCLFVMSSYGFSSAPAHGEREKAKLYGVPLTGTLTLLDQFLPAFNMNHSVKALSSNVVTLSRWGLGLQHIDFGGKQTFSP